MILLIDNYDSFTYNVQQYVQEMGVRCRVVRNDAITVRRIAASAPTHIIISPGPGGPADAGISVDVVLELGSRIPILGICLGHQVIGHAFGGRVAHARRPVHGKTATISHDGRGIFTGMPEPFTAVRYHSLAVLPGTLPETLQVTATAEDGTVMGIRHRDLPIEGVQFHPESIATEGGRRMIRNFVDGIATRRPLPERSLTPQSTRPVVITGGAAGR